ncbi:MAG: DUF4259 domain-containing protein [Promicromonosporaceae bacterium]|nr:DUF4259 domain-containing protein [Promicromonosporaceae bacterium]
MDLLYEIANGYFNDAGTIEESFGDPDYLEVDGGQMAIALGAIIRSERGEAGPTVPEVDRTDFRLEITPELVTWVRAQITRALSGSAGSELYALWEESSALEEWLEVSRSAMPSAL